LVSRYFIICITRYF